MTTRLRPSSGKIAVLGRDILRGAAEIRFEIACAAQRTSIETYLSAEENMMFQSRLYKVPKNEAKERMERLLEEFGLTQYRKYMVRVNFNSSSDVDKYFPLLREKLPSREIFVRSSLVVVNSGEPSMDIENVTSVLLNQHIPFREMKRLGIPWKMCS